MTHARSDAGTTALAPVLVTGAAGFIGSHVAEALLARGTRVIGVDNFDPFYDVALKRDNVETIASRFGSRFSFEALDLTDAPSLARLMEREKPRVVIHLAAKAGVRPSIADPAGYAHANVTATSIVLAKAHAAGCDRVVVASSSSVYGNASKVPFSELDPCDAPISPYAATKRACELLGHAHHHLTKQPVAMLRFFTVYGPRQRPDLAIMSFMRRMAMGEPITVFGDGSMSRDYTFIDDVVAGVLAAVDHIPQHGFRIWNLGGNRPVALRDMVSTIAKVVGKTPQTRAAPNQPGDVERTFADLSRSKAELGYAPGTSFEEGVARQWAWLKGRLSRPGA